MTTALRPDLFTDQRVLITGGGTGIGLVTARLFGSLGAKVAICGRREEVLREAAESLESEGITCMFATCDIREPDTINALMDRLIEAWGGLDILVNNAGGQFPSPAQHISPKGFAAVVRNNLMGTWNMTHGAAERCFLPAKRGVIVNVIAQIERGFPGMAHTGAARAGVDNLTKSLAVEWAPFNIRVMAVAPGTIRSSGTDRYPPELIERARRAVPQKRLGTPEQVAELIAMLSSPTIDFLTGRTVYIDGGQSLWGDIWDLPERELPDEPEP